MLTSTCRQSNRPAPYDGNSITAADLQKMPLPPINWIVPELLPAGLTILAGAPKAGKSWLALDLALCVGAGTDFLDQPTRAGNVIYYALEDSINRIQTRINLLSDNQSAPNALHLSFSLCHDQMIGELRSAISRHNPSLIVLDTIGRLGVKTTSHYDLVYKELSTIKLLADAAGISIICVTHTHKQPVTDPFSRILGSTALSGAVDTIWVLLRNSASSDDAHLYLTGRDVSQQALRVRFTDHRWLVQPDDASSQMAKVSPLYQYLAQISSFRGLSSSLCADYCLYCLKNGLSNNLSGADANVSFGRQLRQVIPLLQSAGKQVDIQHTTAGNLITITGQEP